MVYFFKNSVKRILPKSVAEKIRHMQLLRYLPTSVAIDDALPIKLQILLYAAEQLRNNEVWIFEIFRLQKIL